MSWSRILSWIICVILANTFNSNMAISAPPSGPSSLHLRLTSKGHIRIRWSDNSKNEKGFQIQRRIGASRFDRITNLPKNTITFVDRDPLPANIPIAYRIRAYNDQGSGYSGSETIITPPHTPPGSVVANLHQNKAGVYVRLNHEDFIKDETLYLTHPLLDAIFYVVRWREVEPNQGTYDFTVIERDIEKIGAAGKGVVLLIAPYGQALDKSNSYRSRENGTNRNCFYEAHVPKWFYEESNIEKICFEHKNEPVAEYISLPNVWNGKFFDKYVLPLVEATSKTFSKNPHVWYVMPGIGHLGQILAQPSLFGRPAMIENGWTVKKWEAYAKNVFNIYQEHFPQIPLLLKSHLRYFRDTKKDGIPDYRVEARNLIFEWTRNGMSYIQLDIQGDHSRIASVFDLLKPILPNAWDGLQRLGLGDDWPLWVPLGRREEQATLGRDDEYYESILGWMTGGVSGLPQIPVSIYFAHSPELLASHPKNVSSGERSFSPRVYDILSRFRHSLLENDPCE